jgi:uncharacterized protein involved in exopolysaccharide biosynthesis
MTDRIARLRPQGETRGGESAWPQPPWYRSPRARLFIAVFGVVLALGCLFTLLQDTTWRSTAVVLMSAPEAVDEVVATSNTQQTAIQSRILLGPEVIGALSGEMQEYSPGLAGIEGMLTVVPVDDTDMVEMSAEGSEREVLPTLVNSWIDVYLDIRAGEVDRRKAHTLQQVEDELAGLDAKLQEARTALDAYRRQHDIISSQREENEVLARLDGLNRALNTAIEDEVRARANLDTLRDAARRGERVIPRDQLREVASLESELRRLQGEMAELEKRYTTEYINKQPQLRAVVERIEELQQELNIAYERGRESELGSARQAHAAAQQSVADLQDKLARHRQSVAEFTSIYATHDALVEDLARLEELNRETRARQVQVEIRDLEKYPPVSVIQRAPLKSERTGPDYLRLFGITVGLAFALAVLSVWLRGFLGHQVTQPTVVSVELVPPQTQAAAEIEYAGEQQAQLGDDGTPRLDDHSDEQKSV